jgi:uncharacterized protein (DUF2132 family)
LQRGSRRRYNARGVQNGVVGGSCFSVMASITSSLQFLEPKQKSTAAVSDVDVFYKENFINLRQLHEDDTIKLRSFPVFA